MTRVHVVEQGEHIGTIADQNGFACVETIWDDPENAKLRSQRDNPFLLLPGDVVHVPEHQTKKVAVVTGAQHPFVARRTPLRLRVRILGIDEQPAGEIDVKVGEEITRTDPDGFIDRSIPCRQRNLGLTLGDTALDLDIGGLDPAEESSGLQARLNNLGYDAGEPGDEDAEQIEFAISLFQRDHGLPVDGQVTPALIQELKALHGC